MDDEGHLAVAARADRGHERAEDAVQVGAGRRGRGFADDRPGEGERDPADRERADGGEGECPRGREVGAAQRERPAEAERRERCAGRGGGAGGEVTGDDGVDRAVEELTEDAREDDRETESAEDEENGEHARPPPHPAPPVRPVRPCW